MNAVDVVQGDGPIILGLPHTGTFVPSEIFAALNDKGKERADTDWHIDKLYDGLIAGVTTVRANFHRYVIDANRDPSGGSLYPGQNTTGLVPLTDFEGENIWAFPPDEDEVERRCVLFHTPYHTAISAELERVHKAHGYAILYDCHSIRSHIPFLFEGKLPDFNIGTNNNTTCALQIERDVAEICSNAEGYTSILNGRFKGGWTTRHYGRPDKNHHAIQMELAQSTYLQSENDPWIYDETKADKLRVYLRKILSTLNTGLGKKS